MHSFQSLAITALVALPALVTADIISGGINGNQCPSDWSNIQYKDIRRCCYGSLTVESNDPYCCVHSFSLSSNNNNIEDVKSDCFPFCTVTRGSLPTMTLPGSGASCETKIAFTTDDYSSLVSAASASATGTKASDSDSTTTTTSGSGSETETGKKFGETSTSTNMAGPIATAESFAIGGAAVAAAFFAL